MERLPKCDSDGNALSKVSLVNDNNNYMRQADRKEPLTEN